MSEFIRETRYIVIKSKDAQRALTIDEREQLAAILSKVNAYRFLERAKNPLQCVVVERDWPEYEPTWKAIEARVSLNGRDSQ